MLRAAVQLPLDQILQNQRRLIARRQLLAAGVDDVAICRKIRRTEWQRVLPGVYGVAVGSLTLEHRRIAAALFAGEHAQLTGAATLLWYGFTSPIASDRVHVLVPHEVHRRSAGFVVVQRTHRLDKNARDVGNYRITSTARAVIDACRMMSDLNGIRAIVSEAVQRSIVTAQALDSEIRGASRSRTALVRRAFEEIMSGVRSSPEAELRDITLRSKALPRIIWNPHLVDLGGTTLPTPDGWIPDAGIALEVDSSTHHSTGDGWRTTLRRSNILCELGAIVLHFTPAEIRAEPNRVLRVIEQTYRVRAGFDVAVRVIEGRPA